MANPQVADDATPTAGMGRALAVFLAVVCGASVANIYYAQPLLPVIAGSWNLGDGASGLVVTAAQVGYAVALALVLPLGDVVERRSLVVTLLAAAAVALLATAVAPSYGMLLGAIAVVGVTSAVAQVVVPLAASLAAERERGRVLGIVLAGLIVGIMLSRVLAGLLAALGGWRLVFVVAAGLMAVLALASLRWITPTAAPARRPYAALLRSVVDLVRQEREVRRRSALAAAGMSCFTVVWTASSFLLAGPTYGLGPIAIGMFGLAGLVGAVAASLAGVLVDRGHGDRVVGVCLAVLATGWAPLGLGIVGGALGIVLVVLGMGAVTFAQQALLTTHQSALFAALPAARSRVTTVVMVASFAGSAATSALVAAIYPTTGWIGSCVLGAAIAIVALTWWRHPRRAPARDLDQQNDQPNDREQHR